MDSAEFFDTVKAEKAKAVLRYRRMSQLKVLMHAAEVSVAVFILLSWCFGGGLSLLVDSSVDRFLRLFDLFRRPLTVFILSNIIIIVIVLLSRTDCDNTKKENSLVAHSTYGIYDEYVGYVSRRANIPVPEVPGMIPGETPVETLQIVPYVPKHPEPAKPIECTETNASRVRASASTKMDARVGSQKQYKRTKSTLAKPCRRETNDRVLRRSMTENGRDSAKRSVDDLSTEEFNQTVESFITRTRCFMQREIIADMTDFAVAPKQSHGKFSNFEMAVIVRN